MPDSVTQLDGYKFLESAGAMLAAPAALTNILCHYPALSLRTEASFLPKICPPHPTLCPPSAAPCRAPRCYDPAVHPFLNDEKLRKAERLLNPAEFEAVFEARQSAGNRFVVLHWRPNGLGHPRLGLVVSRRFGNAVARNRFKRRVRELFRRNKRLAGSLDILVLPSKRPEAATATLEDTRDSLLRLLRKAGGDHATV